MRKQTLFAHFSKSTKQEWFSWAMTALRVGIGLQFLNAGVSKMSDWSAEGYLLGSSGPLQDWFVSMAGNPVVDVLNIWGLTLIGLGLILGLLVRPAAFFGAIMMILYYLAHFESNTEHGLIEEHIILALIFVVFMAGGVGHMLGLDGVVSRSIRKGSKWSFLFG